MRSVRVLGSSSFIIAAVALGIACGGENPSPGTGGDGGSGGTAGGGGTGGGIGGDGGAGGSVDSIPPEVLAIAPGNGASGVALGVAVMISFDEAMADSTLGGISLAEVGGAAVTVTSVYNDIAYLVTLTPDSPLAAYTEYEVVVPTTVTDVAGNHLAEAVTETFTTLDPTPPTPPGTPTSPVAFTADVNVSFAWTGATDPESSVTSYIIEVFGALAQPPLTQANTGPTTSYLYAGHHGEKVRARVAAVNGSGVLGPFSGLSDPVVIDTTAPPAPAAPMDGGAFSAESTLIFEWAPVVDPESGVVSYWLEVSLSDTFTGTSLFDQEVGDTLVSYVDLGGQVSDTNTVFARVAATNAAGDTGSFSPASDGITIDSSVPARPGAPTDGPLDFSDIFDVTFTWGAVSGAQSYLIQIAEAPGGTELFSVCSTDTTQLYSGSDGQSLFARVAASAGTDCTQMSAWSAWSDGVVIDENGPPSVDGWDPSWGDVEVSADMSIWFGEPMDRASVEEAFTLARTGGGEPLYGYAFYWPPRDEDRRVIIQPDTEDPPGITNRDLLVGQSTFTIALADTAADARGRPLTTAWNESFTTRVGTLPNLVSFTAGGVAVASGPALAANVERGDNLLFTFSAPLDNGDASVQMRGPGVDREYGLWSANLTWNSSTELELELEGALRPGGEYVVRLRDLHITNGIWLEEIELLIQVAAVDLDPPELLSSFPLNGTANHSGAMPIILNYSDPLDVTTLHTIQVSSDTPLGTGGALSSQHFIIDYRTDPMVGGLFLYPKTALPPDAEITVILPSTLLDLAGNPAQMQTLTFTTEPAAAGSSHPVVELSSPPQNAVVEYGDRVRIRVVDEISGLPTTLASATVNHDSFLYSRDIGGVMVPCRGWRVRHEPGAATIEIDPGPLGQWPGPDWETVELVSAQAQAGDLFEVTTARPHGMIASPNVSVQLGGTPDGVLTGRLDAVTGPDTFTVELTSATFTDATFGAGVAWLDYAHTLAAVTARAGAVRSLERPEETLVGGITFILASGDPALGDQDYTPYLSYLGRSLLSGNTSPAGQSLDLHLDIRDDDRGIVDLTIADEHSGGVDIQQSIDTSGNDGHAYYEQGGGPAGADLDGMNHVAYNSSAHHDFTITVADQDGNSTEYTEAVWVWSTNDLPGLTSVGGSAVATTAPVLTHDNTPTLVWGNVDTTNANGVGLYLFDISALGGGSGNPTGYFQMHMLPSVVNNLTVPRSQALPVGIYTWAVVQVKLSPEIEPASMGWSLSQGDFEPFFVYGPSNDDLQGSKYGYTQIGVITAEDDPGFGGTWDTSGIYDFTGQTLVMPLTTGGSSAGNAEVFAYDDATGDFVITRDTIVTGRGWLGRSGDLMLTTQLGQSSPSFLNIGTLRTQSTGFTASDADGAWSFVQLEVRTTDGGATFESARSSVGRAVANANHDAFTVALKNNSMTASDDLETLANDPPYTIADDGLVSMQVGDWVSGFIGGAGNDIFTMANDDDELAWWILIAREYPLTSGIDGRYNFVELVVMTDESDDSYDGAMTALGTMDFDDATGNVEYAYNVGGTTGVGDGTFTYGTDTVILTIAEGPGASMDIELRAGPDADTLFGIPLGSSSLAGVLILSR